MSENQVYCTSEGCDMVFSSLSTKTKHVKDIHGEGQKHNDEKTIKCNQCDKYFKKMDYVRKHVKRVHEKRITQEDSVDMSFDDASNKSTSSLNSTLALDNAVEFSDMSFADETLIEDTTIEIGKESQGVEITTSTTLKKEKTFKCSQCDKMFGKRSYARMHEKRIHKENGENVLKPKIDASVDVFQPQILEDPKENLWTEELLVENVPMPSTQLKGNVDENVLKNEKLADVTLHNFEPLDELFAIPGSSKDKNPVFNIYESILYTSEHPMSRRGVARKGKDDFKCKVCGVKSLTKRSQVKHLKGHGTFLNYDFLTDFIDHENESILKNTCLRKSSVSLKLPKIGNLVIPTSNINLEREVVVDDILEGPVKGENDQMSLSEMCDDLMDIGDFLI